MTKIITSLFLAILCIGLGSISIEYQLLYVIALLLSLYAFAIHSNNKSELQNQKDFQKLKIQYQKLKDSYFDFTVTLGNGDTKTFRTGAACFYNGCGNSEKACYNSIETCKDVFNEYNQNESYRLWSIADAKLSFELQKNNQKFIYLMNGDIICVEAMLQLHKTV